MSYKLSLPPNITGATEKEQLAQMKTYLYQLVGDVQFALNDLEKKAVSNTKQTEETTNEREKSGT